MALYFLRHIKTVYNKQRIFSGRAETEVLPGQKIKYTDDIMRFDYIFSSSSSRCMATVQLIPDFLKNNSEICFTSNLLERKIGLLEGMQKRKAEIEYPEFFFNGRVDVNAQIPEMESINDVVERVSGIVEYICDKSKNSECLICSHNQTLKIIYAMITEQNIDNDYWHKVNFENGAIVKVL